MKRSVAEGPVSRLPENHGPLFELAPNIRTEPPTAPGSKTSRAAAECVSDPMRRRSHRLIFHALSASSVVMSMHDLSEAADIPVHILCARLRELVPMWVECREAACWSHVKPGLRVNGYGLTTLGGRRYAQSIEDNTDFRAFLLASSPLAKAAGEAP